MKIPSCQCGSITGWLNDIQCSLCGCWPWQHSSDEEVDYDYDSSNQDSDEALVEFARNEVKLKLHEEKLEKIAHIDRAIFAGQYCIKADEDRFLMIHSMWENEKKYKKNRLRSRRFRNSIRRPIQPFVPKKYYLDVYNYYKCKSLYEEEILMDYFEYLGLDAEKKMKQYLDAELQPSEIKLADYEDFLKQ